jgi:hypothetical protein
MSHKFARIFVLGSLLAIVGTFVATPSAMAYGRTAQWQIGFSGTCTVSSVCGPIFGIPGTGGFWGWCEFGGSNGSAAIGTTGTTADCQITTYSRTSTGVPTNPFHISYDVTGWVIQKSSPITFPPGGPDFLLTSGTLELSGPGAPFPTGVPFPFSQPGCPPQVCDTGIPPVPGHFSFHPVPGVELNIQVNKLS